jgi:hypothetical protein
VEASRSMIVEGSAYGSMMAKELQKWRHGSNSSSTSGGDRPRHEGAEHACLKCVLACEIQIFDGGVATEGVLRFSGEAVHCVTQAVNLQEGEWREQDREREYFRKWWRW